MRKRTMLWLPRKGWTWPGAALLAIALIAVTCPGSVSGREASAQPGTPTGAVTTVPLEYQETGFQFLFRHVPVERRLAPFPKEPALAHGPVVRGVFKFGGNPSNAIAFVWVGGAKKLLLDLNRNQDLTDDPSGVIPATVLWSAGPSFIHQMFTNVPLAFPATSAGAPMVVDLELGMDMIRRPGEPLFTACLRSYWQGKVTREGHDWQVGLMQNLSDQPGSFQRGELLLRPWEERNKRFIASCEVPMDTLPLAWVGKNWMVRASDAFAFSPKVFFEGHAYQLDWSVEPRGREEGLALRLTEQPTALGELRITGSSIQRLVLTGGPYLVVMAQPPASVKVPPGRYYPYRVWLNQGKAEAVLELRRATIREGECGGGNLGGADAGVGPAAAGAGGRGGGAPDGSVGRGRAIDQLRLRHPPRAESAAQLPIDWCRRWRLLAGGGVRREAAAVYRRQIGEEDWVGAV